MKNLYIFLLLLLGVGSFGQVLPGVETNLSPGGLLENVFDNYGNKYSLSDIKINTASTSENRAVSSSSILCTAGMFELYFETGSGMSSTTDAAEIARRTVVCQVFTDLSNFINSLLKTNGQNNKVRIWVRNIGNINGVPANALGLASSFYNMPKNTANGFGGIIDNEIWKTITLGKDSFTNVASPLSIYNTSPNASGAFYHGMMAFNFSDVTWNTNLAINSPIGQYDLYSVVLHEVTHALGFASLISNTGSSRFQFGFNYYSRYDGFLKNNAGTQFLITNGTTNCSTMYNYSFNTSYLSTTVLQPNTASCITPNTTTCANAVKFIGTSTTPVYTPNCFIEGSSLSHFEDLCVAPNVNDAYFVMSNLSSNGSTVGSVNTKRFLKPEERNTLSDIGYSLNTTFGNNSTAYESFKNYGGTLTTGINVAGINDGITTTGNYAFMVNSGATIFINDILSNDSNATNFECLQDVYSTATLPVISGNSTTNISFSSTVSGLHLLRYVPINATGKKGNITYIYVYVLDSGACTPVPKVCDLVMNGNFEQHNGFPTDGSQLNGIVCGWNAAHIYQSNEYFHSENDPSLQLDVPCNSNGYENDNQNGKAYVGMFNQEYNGNSFSETIRTKLKSPLLANTAYQLSFDVSLAEGYSLGAIKFQAYLSTNLFVPAGISYIPIANEQMLFTNPTYSTTSNGWERITFNIPPRNIAGEEYLYLGGLTSAKGPLLYPLPASTQIAGCGPSPFLVFPYYYLDNVSIIPLNGSSFSLPSQICIASSISNLNTYLTATPTGGIYTGNGVINLNGAYSFNATLAGLGVHQITYAYTNSSGCIIQITSNISVISSSIITIFNPVAPICSGSSFPTLPSISNNGITGTWSPEPNNITTTTYTFTPSISNEQCASVTSLTVIIYPPNIIPTFNLVTSICSGATLTELPTISDNNITGSWSQALNNTATTTYTFTPASGQCATTTTVTITVLPSNNPACAANCLPDLTLLGLEINNDVVYQRQDWIIGSNYGVSANQDVTLKAGDYILLKGNTNTFVKAGSLFLAQIEDCEISNSRIINPNFEKQRLDNRDSKSIITIYPNPSKEYVTIDSESSKIKSITISSMEGKIVFFNGIINNNSQEINMSNYQNGIYIVYIETFDGEISRQKLVIE
ncbi:T9SS type A sorting domain-containing protein [Flavobacterium sp.]|uniref:T9SS type A sorting domain-containing protein n=1 Tax=Flavobacterium sp. TaxID=239 RepID=UPI00286DA521|nr:T9SS type A sorting domain-containing protein [Flavobacterium sp.]